MENIYKLKPTGVFLLVILIFNLVSTTVAAYDSSGLKTNDDEPLIIDFDDNKKVREGEQFPRTLLPDDHLNEEYSEDSYRRFDVVFFLSLPFIIGYQILIHQLLASYSSINGQNSGSISTQQLLYLGVTSLILAGGIAYSDYAEVKRKKEIMDAEKLSTFNNYREPYRIQFSLNFSF